MKALVSDSQMASIRKLGVRGMVEDIIVHHHQKYEEDPDAPYGDDVLHFHEDTDVIKGWITANPSPSGFVVEQGMVANTQDYTLRVPVGSPIEPQDDVTIKGLRYRVVQTSVEDSWKEWLECTLLKRDE